MMVSINLFEHYILFVNPVLENKCLFFFLVLQMEESAEIIEDRPHYNVTNLDAPDPILHTSTKSQPNTTKVEKQASSQPTQSSKPKYEPFLLPLTQLHSLREYRPSSGQGYPHLSFYLKDGKTLPMLHFHDGGITGLFKAMSPRYVYLLRSIKEPTLISVEDFSKYNTNSGKSHTGVIASLAEFPSYELKVRIHYMRCVQIGVHILIKLCSVKYGATSL